MCAILTLCRTSGDLVFLLFLARCSFSVDEKDDDDGSRKVMIQRGRLGWFLGLP